MDFVMISSCCERGEPNAGMGSGIPIKWAWQRIASGNLTANA